MAGRGVDREYIITVIVMAATAMPRLLLPLLLAAAALATAAGRATTAAAAAAHPRLPRIELSVETGTALQSTSPYFRGFNIDMSAGASPHIPAHANREFFSIDFADAKLVYLAKSLAATGAFLRIGGTGNDYVEYGGGIGAHRCNASISHKNCLNATHMAGLCTLIRESGAKVGPCLNPSHFPASRPKLPTQNF